MTNATLFNSNLAMYGVPDIVAYVNSVKASSTYKFTGANMIVAGLMSDAQELIADGEVERAREGARQTLNIAKHILFLIADGELVGTVERK